jgi:hypothetical protein
MNQQSNTSYQEKLPESFVEWGQRKIAEWERSLEDVSLPLLQREKLKYDISYLMQAIARVGNDLK